jgi:hypothetical protein
MPNYPVFTSYAQADLKGDASLDRFVKKFRENLRSLLGRPDTDDLVFFDQSEVNAGDDWMMKILDVVRTADVLVCLMSPTYLGREWCGRELEVFVRRKDSLPAGQDARFILPVWWQLPLAPRAIPSRLGRFNYRDPQFPPDYEKLGIQGLARHRKTTQVSQMAYRIAELIGETLAGPHRLPQGPAVAKAEEIVNAFDEQQPFDVRLLALPTGGNSWQPNPAETTVAEAAAQVARRLQVFIRPLATGPGLAARLQQAQTEQQVLLFIVDAALPIDATLHEIDALSLPNLALLLVDAGTPAIGGETWLGQLPGGCFSKAKDSGLMRVAVAGAMTAEMERLVDEARRRLRAPHPAARAEDTGLAASALAQGIAVETQPILAGPNREEEK